MYYLKYEQNVYVIFETDKLKEADNNLVLCYVILWYMIYV